MAITKSGKYLLTLGCIAIGFLLVVSLRAHVLAATPGTEVTVSNLVQYEQENRQLAEDNAKLQNELLQYQSSKNATDLANEQLDKGRISAGLEAMTGPGVRITLDDSNQRPDPLTDSGLYVIHEDYIKQLVNILWNGGAEAISVNGQRVTTYTEVFCSGSVIQINGTRQVPPFKIEAIGDPQMLKAALDFWYWKQLEYYQERYGITRSLEEVERVIVPAGKLKEYRYAEPVKEGK